jgi:hypothetical protein
MAAIGAGLYEAREGSSGLASFVLPAYEGAQERWAKGTEES